ncbi:hypothetical protein [Paenibacillus sp. E194]|uniref:hypothetical protein n=1 Tax=Paenibacillus sp. E194 TaxID=1458845 RepID=UPI0012E09986|nr:hypothetical protein [Paenibacillus sp. E194]
MNRSDDASKTKNGCNAMNKPSVLWRDIIIAYAAPALMAGIGGVVIGRSDPVHCCLYFDRGNFCRNCLDHWSLVT